ncbi:hypothetical protein GBA52_000882 [Prunus armeniaca]|nr:hypothetical protein GBA52_000882 [Prunus armeniaca]
MPLPIHPAVKFEVLTFLNSILLLNQLNQVVVIATGYNSCSYIYDSSTSTNQGSDNGRMPARCVNLLQKLEEFVIKDEQLIKEGLREGIASSLLSGSLSMALCYIQRVFRSGPLHPQPRILCLQGSSDGPEQYVAIMNAIFSAQRSMTVFATDLHSRAFLQLPKSLGVDFRASCFCHKKTIDMGYICSVCLSIFCKHHKKCQYLVKPSQMLTQHPTRKEKLQRHNVSSLNAYCLSSMRAVWEPGLPRYKCASPR